MKKTLMILLILALPLSCYAWGIVGMSGSVAQGDTTKPTIDGATVNAAGTQLTITLSESCSRGAGFADSQFSFNDGSANALTYVSGDPGSSWVFSTANTVYQGDTCTLAFDGGATSILDGAGNYADDDASITVTNGSEQSAAANGFVGTRAPVVDSEYQTGQNTPHSHFVCSASGTVSYIYVRRYDDNQDMTVTKPGIWSSDGATLLASSSDCSCINPSTNLYRYTLSSPITVTSGTTYTLGYAMGIYFYPPYTATAGAIYLETGTSHTYGQCPALNSSVTHDDTFSTNGQLAIWASNDPDEQ